jgi:hypothetical protein
VFPFATIGRTDRTVALGFCLSQRQKASFSMCGSFDGSGGGASP